MKDSLVDFCRTFVGICLGTLALLLAIPALLFEMAGDILAEMAENILEFTKEVANK